MLLQKVDKLPEAIRSARIGERGLLTVYSLIPKHVRSDADEKRANDIDQDCKTHVGGTGLDYVRPERLPISCIMKDSTQAINQRG